jgi:hypothetical protein
MLQPTQQRTYSGQQQRASHRAWALAPVQQQRCCCLPLLHARPVLSCSSRAAQEERSASTFSISSSGNINGALPAMLAGVAVGTAVAVLQWLGPSVPASYAVDLNPYQEAKQMVYGPTADGSIRGCPSNVNPNCVSTGEFHQQLTSLHCRECNCE